MLEQKLFNIRLPNNAILEIKLNLHALDSAILYFPTEKFQFYGVGVLVPGDDWEKQCNRVNLYRWYLKTIKYDNRKFSFPARITNETNGLLPKLVGLKDTSPREIVNLLSKMPYFYKSNSLKKLQ